MKLNKKDTTTPIENHFNTDIMTYTINKREYAITDSKLIKVQAVADDVNLYGWSLEFRWKEHKDSWHTYWNHRIYVNRSSALDAATKVFINGTGVGYDWNKYEWRIVPIYKMNEPEYREYKIDQLLNTEVVNKEPKVYEIKAWKAKNDIEVEIPNKYPANKPYLYKCKKNSMFIQMENGNIRIVKNSTEPKSIMYEHSRYILEYLIKNELIEEVNIKNEKWAHPHLCKELKKKIKL
jgi:hypothetical protein